MGDSTIETTSSSATISPEKETPTPETIKQSPEEKIIATTESCEEKVQKLHERIELETVAKKEESKEESLEKKSAPITKASEEVVKEKPTENQEKVTEKPDKLPENEGKMPEKQEETKLETCKEELNENAIKNISGSVPYCPKKPREKIIRNQSDIFSLKDISTTLQTSIFSINGSPSRKLFRKQEPAGHVFQRNNENPPSDKTSPPRSDRLTKENYNDEKRPSSSYRNPLTGTGLSSNDEYKSKGSKRKDGNPLLGLGYDSEVNSSSSQHRIPPGGFSHKLW